jgi:hypothetical protein
MEDAMRSFEGVLAEKPTNLVALLGKVCRVIFNIFDEPMSPRLESSMPVVIIEILSGSFRTSLGTTLIVYPILELALDSVYGHWITRQRQRRHGKGVWKWYVPSYALLVEAKINTSESLGMVCTTTSRPRIN